MQHCPMHRPLHMYMRVAHLRQFWRVCFVYLSAEPRPALLHVCRLQAWRASGISDADAAYMVARLTRMPYNSRRGESSYATARNLLPMCWLFCNQLLFNRLLLLKAFCSL